MYSPDLPKKLPNLGLLFHNNSSNINYDQDFLTYSQRNVDTVNAVDPLNSHQSILNFPLKIKELEDALYNSKSKSLGHNRIPYSFIKNSKTTQNIPQATLLAIYNTIWDSNIFPNSWTHGYVTPLIKPNKNKFLADSYRSICLLDTLCNLLEKIVNRRLI